MDTFCHNFAPFYDTNPNCKPDERYKAIGGIIQQGGIHVFASPDGIHWHLLADGPVITRCIRLDEHGVLESRNRKVPLLLALLPHCG